MDPILNGHDLLNYLQGSTKGIAYLNPHHNTPYLKFINPPSPRSLLLAPFPSQTPPIHLCSSSNGFLLFLDNSSSYYICNTSTYSQEPRHGYRKIPKRRTNICTPNDAIHHPIGTPSVPSLDHADSAGHQIFYISCPIEIKKCVYRIDTFCSNSGWRWSEEEIELSSPIISNTATSCGRMVYWLTVDEKLVCYDPITRMIPLPPLALPLMGEVVSMQLGVVMGNRVAVVMVSPVSVEVYQLSEDGESWGQEILGHLFVRLRTDHDTSGWNGLVSTVSRTATMTCRELPKPLRFESSRVMQVLLVIDGRLFVWEDVVNSPGARIIAPVYLQHEVPTDYFVDAVPVARSDLEISGIEKRNSHLVS